jgi:hypothetical protein
MEWTIASSFFRGSRPVSCLRRSDGASPSGPTAMLILTQTLQMLKILYIEQQGYVASASLLLDSSWEEGWIRTII